MAHEITINKDGKAEMAYFGKTPWHGLGTELDAVATWADVVKAASLDWEVEMQPVYLSGGVPIANKKAVVRKDTKEVFGVFTDHYTPLQNAEFGQFFDAVVGAGEAIYHTAGSLNGGRRVWALAKLPGTLEITKNDRLDKYVLLANSHDGTLAVTMQLTTVRVVCNNTMSFALGRGQKFRAIHSPNVLGKAVEAREFLGLQEAYFQNMMAGIERLAAATINEEQLDELIFKVFSLDDTKAMADQHYLPKFHAEAVKSLFLHGQGNDLPGVAGTAWAALNAVTEYIDHVRPTGVNVATSAFNPEAAANDGKRLSSAWFGAGARLKQSAWNVLTDMDLSPAKAQRRSRTPATVA